ncbi:MAG: hypothetical protein HQ546_09585, partial [Planctomycetes bacterium]|nr:hypothetical protein [Planctomycetota bacterium]
NKTDVGIEGIEIDTDFLFDLHARPHLECGPNKVFYKDATPGDFDRDVEVEFTVRPAAVPPVSREKSRIVVPGIENTVPADGMGYFWVRVALRDADGRPISYKKVFLTSSRPDADEITWMPTPARDHIANGMQFATLVLNHATFKYNNFRIRGELVTPSTPEHGVDDWNGYICFMVQSRQAGTSTLTAATKDGQEVGSVDVRFAQPVL